MTRPVPQELGAVPVGGRRGLVERQSGRLGVPLWAAGAALCGRAAASQLSVLVPAAAGLQLREAIRLAGRRGVLCLHYRRSVGETGTDRGGRGNVDGYTQQWHLRGRQSLSCDCRQTAQDSCAV